MIATSSDDPTNDEPLDGAGADRANLRRRSSWMTGLAIGLIGGLVLTCVGWFWFRPRGESLPDMTRERFDAALAQWEERAPAKYTIDIRIEGNRPGVVRVRVADGRVVEMTRDGVSPKQKRTWDAWSVPGMFDTIDTELSAKSDPAASFAGQSGGQLVLRGEFDAEYGYPRRYQRIVLGAQQEMRWEVTSFRAGE